MATRCAISRPVSDGYQVVVVHWDGYPVDESGQGFGVGETLRRFYSTRADVANLFDHVAGVINCSGTAGGHISQLGELPSRCIINTDADNECAPLDLPHFIEITYIRDDLEYVYVWDEDEDERWDVYDNRPGSDFIFWGQLAKFADG